VSHSCHNLYMPTNFAGAGDWTLATKSGLVF
jgi:hypothetical protein